VELSVSSDLADVLLGLVDEATARALAETPQLPQVLDHGLGEARRTWPRIAIAADRFLEQVAAALASPDDVHSLAQLPFAELALVAACADADPVAVDGLVRTYRAGLVAALRRMRLSVSDIDDVLQRLWESLLVGAPGGRPHIADYRGRGDLRGWLRASAVRHALRWLERAQRDVAVDDDDLVDLACGEATAELAYLKRQYAAEFRQAFEVAMAAVSPRQRALLRRHYLDGLTGDRLGELYGGVHRTTATRWFVAARLCVLEHARQELRARLHIGDAEMGGLLRLVESQLDLSVERILATGGNREQ
jgi:RNA polymerase sigma-70 factor (ECF subfamily)